MAILNYLILVLSSFYTRSPFVFLAEYLDTFQCRKVTGNLRSLWHHCIILYTDLCIHIGLHNNIFTGQQQAASSFKCGWGLKWWLYIWSNIQWFTKKKFARKLQSPFLKGLQCNSYKWKQISGDDIFCLTPPLKKEKSRIFLDFVYQSWTLRLD